MILSTPLLEREQEQDIGNGRPLPIHEEEDGIAKNLDAGALFVLKSKGSWLHCGYHLTTSIVAPSLLSLPYAFASLGWIAGVSCLVIGALVTFYSYNLMSMVLEHYAQLGHRHLRFRDMAVHILGPKWGWYYVAPIQFIVCYGSVIGNTLLGGQCMKTIYLLSTTDGTMKLYEFIIIFGCLMLILAQIPSFHSLRYINLISLFLCLTYSACVTAGSIYLGNSSKAPKKDYSLNGNTVSLIFGFFNATAIIATTYGNGIIPEIQATLAPPVKGKMFKGLCVCYAVVTVTFFSVAISGYWAFGNIADSLILSNFLEDDKPLLPKWFILMTTIFICLQLSAVALVYLQPTNEVVEQIFSDPTSNQFSVRNVIPRVMFRSATIVIATTVAAMLPFFGDINSLIGAFGFMPLDFVLPMLFFNATFKPSKFGPIFWLNNIIAVVFSTFAAIAAIAAVRQITIDAKTYQLFANL
ncbi:GABA transporter 1-like [Pistacia vera]|uniref:GABA transporter 1-like n=1 Tax=Pistacia vera TaxID=55513 RepID=UPI001262C5C9|nr:GABA transporter 1-like [Pistacia vera]